MNFRRARERDAARVSIFLGRLLTTLAVLVVLLVLSACASVPPVKAPDVDPGSAGYVLTACSGANPSFCHGFLEAAASVVLAEGGACLPPIYFEDVERVVVPALRGAPPESAAIIPATAAIRRAWPCPSTPSTPPSTTAANLPHLTAAAAARSL